METTAETSNDVLVVSNTIAQLFVTEHVPNAAVKSDQPDGEPTEAPPSIQEVNADQPDPEPPPLQLNVVYRHVDELKEHPDAHRVPPMSTEQFQELYESISRGFRSEFPICINSLGFILDGRHRWKAAKQKKKVWVPCLTMNVADEVDFIYSCALRRDMTPDQRRLLLLARLDHLKNQRQTERASKAGKARHDDSLSVTSSDKQTPQKRDSRKELAKETGESERHLRTAYEFRRDFPDAVDTVLRGERSMSQIKAEAKKKELDRAQKARLAEARKLVRVSDWVKADGSKAVRGLANDSIRTLFIRTADHAAVSEALKNVAAALLGDCHLFAFVPIWREEHHLVKAIESRGFSVKSRLIWHRINDAIGATGPFDAEETILWAIRGMPALKDQHDSRPSVIFSHSPNYVNGIGEPPVALIRELLDYSTLIGECVLSPFGLPNCVIAARQRQRSVNAYEVDDDRYAEGRLLIDKIFDQPSRTNDQIESALADPEPIDRATVLPAEPQLPVNKECRATTGAGA